MRRRLLTQGLLASLFASTSTAAPTAVCHTATSADEPCWGSVIWAKETGIAENPAWYKEYPGLYSIDASVADFQYVLWEKRQHECTEPCDVSDMLKVQVETDNTTGAIVTTAHPTEDSAASHATLWIMISVVVVIGVIIVAAFKYTDQAGKSAKPKKKRALVNHKPGDSAQSISMTETEPSFAATVSSYPGPSFAVPTVAAHMPIATAAHGSFILPVAMLAQRSLPARAPTAPYAIPPPPYSVVMPSQAVRRY